MPRLDIPGHSAKTFWHLVDDIRDEEWAKLLEEATKSKDPFSFEQLVETFERAQGDGFDEEKTRDLLAALAAAMAARLTPGQEDLKVGRLVARSLDLGPRGPDQVTKLETRIEELIGLKNAAFPIKLLSVVNDQPRVFQKARIITDVRPVFSDTGNEDTVRATEVRGTIVHTLRLDVFYNWEPVSIYVSLTPGDLKLLKKAIERAASKEDRLRDEGTLKLFPVPTSEQSDT